MTGAPDYNPYLERLKLNEGPCGQPSFYAPGPSLAFARAGEAFRGVWGWRQPSIIDDRCTH